VDIEWSALGLVLLISLAAGAGLVALVGLGIVALDRRRSGGATAVTTTAMAACFLGAAALVGYGLYLVAAG
jgi:hypothetical protein